MPIRTLQDLYISIVQMMYDAEQQTLAALPSLARAVNHPDLRLALEAHRRQTEEHVRRLEQLFGRHGLRPEPRTSTSVRTLIEETREVMREVEDASAREALLAGAARLIEHHEIVSYGIARSWAQRLGFAEDAEVLERTLHEEETSGEMLSEIANRMATRAAERAERELTHPARPADRATPAAGGGEGPATQPAANGPAENRQ